MGLTRSLVNIGVKLALLLLPLLFIKFLFSEMLFKARLNIEVHEDFGRGDDFEELSTPLRRGEGILRRLLLTRGDP